MKIVVIGDTHGRDTWKRIINKHMADVDRFVFLGDYWDSFDIGFDKQFNNFMDILEFKKAHMARVCLLVGNHDFHYWPNPCAEMYSGYQQPNAFLIKTALSDHQDLLQAAYMWEDILCTHAGVTNTWLKANGFREGEEHVAMFINYLFKKQPKAFCFAYGTGDSYGDHIRQGPLWVRPRSLMRDPHGRDTIRQIVGHTGMEIIEPVVDRYYFIDTVRDNSAEYLVITDGDIDINATYADTNS